MLIVYSLRESLANFTLIYPAHNWDVSSGEGPSDNKGPLPPNRPNPPKAPFLSSPLENWTIMTKETTTMMGGSFYRHEYCLFCAGSM